MRAKTILSIILVLLLCVQVAQAGTNSWISEVDTCQYPRKPAEGALHGRKFKPDNIEISKQWLYLVQGPDWIACDLCIAMNIISDVSSLEGQEYRYFYGAEGNSKEIGAIDLIWKNPDGTRTTLLEPNCGLKIHFLQKDKDGNLPGFIVVHFADKEKSYLAGYFVAKLK